MVEILEKDSIEHDAEGQKQTTASPKTRGVTRRSFVAGTAGAGAMLALGLVEFVPRNALCRPPGAQDESRFLGTCIRCGKCMEICPNGIIVPANIEDGVLGMRTPRLNFSIPRSRLGSKLGWCDHCAEENGGKARCMEVCPTGAIEADPDSTFETMMLGKAEINKDWCLAWLLKGCTVCKNVCPFDAIIFDEHSRPSVDVDLCNGCGACEQACISLEGASMGEGESHRAMNARAIIVKAIEG